MLLLLLPFIACSQPPTTADDAVPPYNAPFGYGVNLGYFPPNYTDKELAALAHGTPDGKEPGFGVTTIRPALFEYFLDQWGYEVRKDAFQYYQDIGLRDVTAFIGFPGERNREQTFYCPGQRSELFRGLYEPIWDDGADGTPVNEANTYALYVWKTATTYKGLIRIWEVWNEPDADNGNAWKTPGMPGNWWENAPEPCETKLKAPFFAYIRLLRIAYEVIKSVDPNAYVAVGGLGWPSYLDGICRYTDNPEQGLVSDKYPNKGGAYFDCMSFHSYPHLDNSLREWRNELNGFYNFRHSDAAIDGLWRLRNRFDTVLKKYGYGTAHPEKLWICTEFNVPRKQVADYLGSNEAQVNFMIKSLVTAQMQGMAQMHVYSLADEAPESSSSEFAAMGLFKNLQDVLPGRAEPNPVAWAFKTTHDQLAGKRYDKTQTTLLQLPENVRGAAFRDTLGQFTYVLWAITQRDRDETTSAFYVFPQSLHLQKLSCKDWQFSQSGKQQTVQVQQIQLTGSPVFLAPTH